MRETGHRLALDLKARHAHWAVKARLDDLECDQAFDRFALLREIDDPHSALAQAQEDAEAPYLLRKTELRR